MFSRCETHHEKVAVYCWKCKCFICHKCALSDRSHEGHALKLVNEVYKLHVNDINEKLSLVKLRLTEYLSAIQNIVSCFWQCLFLSKCLALSI